MLCVFNGRNESSVNAGLGFVDSGTPCRATSKHLTLDIACVGMRQNNGRGIEQHVPRIAFWNEEREIGMEPGFFSLYRIPPLNEMPGNVSGCRSLNHGGNVVPWHPRCYPAVHVIRVWNIRPGDVFDNEVDIIFALPKCSLLLIVDVLLAFQKSFVV